MAYCCVLSVWASGEKAELFDMFLQAKARAREPIVYEYSIL